MGDFFFEEYLNVVTCYEYIISHMFWVTFDATRLPGKRNAAMGKRNAARVTAADIAKSGDLGSLIVWIAPTRQGCANAPQDEVPHVFISYAYALPRERLPCREAIILTW